MRTSYIFCLFGFLFFFASCNENDQERLRPDIQKKESLEIEGGVRYTIEQFNEFLEVGMGVDTVKNAMGNPTHEYSASLHYYSWNPNLPSNMNKKGVYGIVVDLKDQKVVSWGKVSQYR